MTILRFSRDDLSKKLSSLPRRLRTAFAAACAQRLMPGYIRSASRNSNANPQQAIKILDELWNDIRGGSPDRNKLNRDVESCAALIPDYDDSYFDGIEYAEDAICSLIFAIESELKGEAENAAWAAHRAHESLFHFVESLVGHAETRADLARIDPHPLIQTELRRQAADLADLESAAKNPGSEPAIIARIRRRAQADSEFFFRLP
jgi:uncharacterized protein YjaG (DUF416 family)